MKLNGNDPKDISGVAPAERFRRLAASPWFRVLLLAASVLAVYSNTFTSPFVFDDYVYVLNNPVLEEPGLLFRTPSPEELESMNVNIRGSLKTRLLGHLSFRLNHALGGNSPAGYHLFNILLHLLAVLSVYALARLLMGAAAAEGERKKAVGWFAFFAALLFAVHPIETQGVTYVSQRFTSMAALFYMASVACYLFSRRGGGKSWYLLSLGLGLLAVFSKETAFTLPLAILLSEVMLSGMRVREVKGEAGRRAAYMLPFFLIALIVPLGKLLPGQGLGDLLAGATRTVPDLSRKIYFLTELTVIPRYLGLLVFPFGRQSLEHDVERVTSFANTGAIMGGVLILILLALSLSAFIRGLRGGRDRRWALVGFGGLWFFLTISVESSFIPLADYMFEHRVYLPSAGFFLSVSAGLWMLFDRLKTAGGRRVFIALAVLASVVFAVGTIERNRVWGSELSLMADAALKAPGNARVQFNLGNALYKRGKLEAADEAYRLALELGFNGADEAWYNRGVIAEERGYFERAARYYENALERSPENRFMLRQYALLLLDNMGRAPRAAEIFRELIRAEGGGNAQDLSNLGRALMLMQKRDEAIEAYLRAVERRPSMAGAQFNLGVLLMERGELEEAEKRFRLALRHDPSLTQAAMFLKYLEGGGR